MIKPSSKILSVSVLMPVYNSEAYIRKSINSILSQTFTDFEFIIINDGSTDHSEVIIKSFRDERIRYYSNSTNLGIVTTLNRGLSLGHGKYIARMDSDDISLHNRFAIQYDFMEKNLKIAFCGTRALHIDEFGLCLGKIEKPISNDEIKLKLLFSNIIIHPSTFFRTDILKKYRYDADYECAEDYFLFAQITSNHLVANLPQELLLYRTHPTNTTSTRANKMAASRNKVYKFQLNNLLDQSPDDQYINQFADLENEANLNFYQTKRILESLLISNNKRKIYNHYLFKKLLYDKWFVLLRAKGEGNIMYHFFKSPLFSYDHYTWKHFRKLFKQQFYSVFGKKY